MNTPTETLIKALRILSNDIKSDDGVANAAILEAAQRMEEDQEVIFQAGESIKILRQTVKHRNETIDELKQRIKRLEQALEATAKVIGPRCKPTAKLRPWTADEVPLGAWMRFKRKPEDRVLLGWVSVQADRDLWLSEREYSTDCGKTWLPCGVEEGV